MKFESEAVNQLWNRICDLDFGDTNKYEQINCLLHAAFHVAEIEAGEDARQLMLFCLRENAELSAKQKKNE